MSILDSINAAVEEQLVERNQEAFGEKADWKALEDAMA